MNTTTTTTTTTAAERQTIRGACPASGRSASVCEDQTHENCYPGVAVSKKLDAAIARALR